MNIYEKLLEAQSRLKAPKNQYNPFGKYNYRNCEDILEAAKPICKELKAVVFLTDKIVMIGEDISDVAINNNVTNIPPARINKSCGLKKPKINFPRFVFAGIK